VPVLHGIQELLADGRRRLRGFRLPRPGPLIRSRPRQGDLQLDEEKPGHLLVGERVDRAASDVAHRLVQLPDACLGLGAEAQAVQDVTAHLLVEVEAGLLEGENRVEQEHQPAALVFVDSP